MTLLECIKGPEDLKGLSQDQLTRLAGEIRDLLIETTVRTSGHLGPNLGVVELTIAIHRVFDSPRDKVVFDTGHQAYVHKLLTGRVAQFGTLRQRGGLTGYPLLRQQTQRSARRAAQARLGPGDRHAAAGAPEGELVGAVRREWIA